jgi:hypothetical protein
MMRHVGHGTPRGEVPVEPPRASLGHAADLAGWRCCGVDWGEEGGYGDHLRVSHGGDPAGPNAPGGSGQGVEPER